MAFRIRLHFVREPFPVLRGQIQEFHVPFAVSPDRPAEVDRAADHAHAGPVAKDILGVPRVDAADHSDAACLELGKGIAHVPEVPGLRGIETRVVLRHGVAACAAAALDIEDALGGSVMGAVRHVAQDSDLGAAVEPARYRRRTHPFTTISVPSMPMLPTRCPTVPSMVIFTVSPLGQMRPPMPCWPSATTLISRAPSLTASWICSSRSSKGPDDRSTFPLIIRLSSVFSLFAHSPSALFCFLSMHSLICSLSAIALSSMLKPSDMPMGSSVLLPMGAKIFLKFHVRGLEDLHYAFGHFVGIQPPVKLGVLGSDAPRTLAGITEVAAVIFVAEAVGRGLHDIFADRNSRCAKHDQRRGIRSEVPFLAHAACSDQAEVRFACPASRGPGNSP